MFIKKFGFLFTILFAAFLFFSVDSADAASHTVKKGETLTSIAKSYDVSVTALKKSAKISTIKGKVGKKITLPANANLAKAKKLREAAAKKAAAEKKKFKTLRVSSTAYTAYCTGCSGRTKTGFNLRANPNAKVIAVDPRIIPLGTKVWVEGYGTAIAADTGGAIKGNKIDVFMNTKKKAYAWGRKKVTIKVYNS